MCNSSMRHPVLCRGRPRGACTTPRVASCVSPLRLAGSRRPWPPSFFFGLLTLWSAMDFTPVPAGTLGPQALVLRGPDHELQYSTADSFHLTLSTTLHARDGPMANTKLALYSRTGGLLGGYFFTTDPAVLTALAHRGVPSGLKLRGLWLRLVADGVPDDAELTSREFHAAAGAVVGGLDFSALDPAYLLTFADLHFTQPPAAIAGCQARQARSAVLP